MCALWGGASSVLSDVEIERIKQLGVVSQLRGIDSTGMLSCYHKNNKVNFKITKEVTNASNFIYSLDFERQMKETRPFLIAGHCRAATIGSIDYSNAHPYNLGKIVGMKNGTIPFVPGKKHDETDSKALFRILQEEGVEEMAKVADKGGAALVWADTRDFTLNFYRNIGRTLCIMTTPAAIYWASEYGMLALIRDRTGVNYNTAKTEAVPVETHIKYNILRIHKDPVSTKIDVRPVKSYFLPPAPEKEETLIIEKPKSETSVPLVKPPVANENTEPEGVPFRIVGYRGLSMKPHVAKAILSHGCANCAAKVAIKDISEVKMFGKKAWLCSKCSEDPFAVMQVGAHNKELYQCNIIMGKSHGNA